ncbi:MAG: OB-fold nucleic acid binding domain-containing protein, partial [Sedimentisphaerales bacterium]
MLNDLTRICSLKDNVGKTVTIGGWVYHSRPGGKVIFLVVRDGSGLCQCIIEKTAVPEELFRQLSHLG